MQVYTKCSNYASETCPCVLAETGHCLVCSMCGGKDFCDCEDTVSYCILQELMNNGGHAKPWHQVMECEVIYIRDFEENYRLLRVRTADVSSSVFRTPGAFVFIRSRDSLYYDVPISVIYEDFDVDSISLLIQMRGIKTRLLRELKKGDTVYVRGPYMNGILGRKEAASLHDSSAAVICRGIGFLPSLNVISMLRNNHNKVNIYLDQGSISRQIIETQIGLNEVKVTEVDLCDENGELTQKISQVLEKEIREGVKLIHLGVSDYLIKKFIDRIADREESLRPDISCINNAPICCGEGICGACTKNPGPNRTIHLCKEQINLYDYRGII